LRNGKQRKSKKHFQSIYLIEQQQNYLMAVQGHIIIAIDRLAIEKPKIKLIKQERQNL